MEIEDKKTSNNNLEEEEIETSRNFNDINKKKGIN